VHALAKPHLNRLFRVESPILEWSSHHHLNTVVIPSSTVRLHAQAFIFTAGEGNATLTEKITPAIRMQRRPLHMVMVKLPWQANLYAHCMGATSQPRITITTHYTQAGNTVWYLGGQLAEEGVTRSSPEQIAQAQAELVKLFPWADFSQAEWATKHIDRAEAQQTNNQRPDSSSVHTHGNVAVAWPTKLAFAPRLSAQLIAEIKKWELFQIRIRCLMSQC
jgi:hypothetical protein